MTMSEVLVLHINLILGHPIWKSDVYVWENRKQKQLTMKVGLEKLWPRKLRKLKQQQN